MPSKSGQISVRIGRVVNKYKVAKHFALTIEDKHLDFQIHQNQVATDATLDGVYVLRTRVPKKQLSAAETVRSYKALCGVERAFRSLKTVDLKIRPIHHWLEPRMRAHIFLYMLAYYVEWHMREAWRELLFADEDLEAKRQRDPLAPAQRSEQALQKIARRTLDNGIPVHSFQTLLQQLSTIVRNTCRTRDSKSASLTFQMFTTPDTTQRRALELLQAITV